MSQITAAAVQALRARTDMPMMDCKAALTKANGDMEKAVLILREQGAKFQDKKGDRETAEGRIATFTDLAAGLGAILELRCESPSVVKNDRFIELGNELAKQVALKSPANPEELLAQPYYAEPGRTVKDRIADTVGLIRENMRVARFVRLAGPCGSYVHHDGALGVLLQVKGDKPEPQLLRDVCMHITAVVPVPSTVRREEVSEEIVKREMDLARSKAAASGKPANIIERIAEGSLKTWFGENVLVEQPFVKDPTKTVGQLLKSAGLEPVKFVRYKVGELS
jgi:elongation factor Ts